MSSLVDSLGRNYMQEWFDQAYFSYEGRLHKWQYITDTPFLSAYRFNSAGQVVEEKQVPLNDIRGFSFFKFPPMGYRNIGLGGMTAVMEAASNRSARRGLSRRCVRAELLPIHVITPRVNSAFARLQEGAVMQTIFFPEYTAFPIGIAAMLQGKSAGFAVSAQVAVTIDIEARDQNNIIILYRGKRVGFVDAAGTAVFTSKVVPRSTLREVLK